MFQVEIEEAYHKLKTGSISFRKKGGGFYYPDKLIDRTMIRLVGVRYIPSKNEDTVIGQFANKAWVDFAE